MSEWKYLHSQELCAWGKKKQGKTSRGNRGKRQKRRGVKVADRTLRANRWRRHLAIRRPVPEGRSWTQGSLVLSDFSWDSSATFCWVIRISASGCSLKRSDQITEVTDVTARAAAALYPGTVRSPPPASFSLVQGELSKPRATPAALTPHADGSGPKAP